MSDRRRHSFVLLLVLGLPIELVEGLAVASRRRTARLLAAARL